MPRTLRKQRLRRFKPSLKADIYRSRGLAVRTKEVSSASFSPWPRGHAQSTTPALFLRLMRLHDLKPRPGAKHRARNVSAKVNRAAMAKPAGAVAKAKPPAPAAPSVSASKVVKCPSFAVSRRRGFNNARHTTRYIPINLEALNAFDDGATVDEAILRERGLANGPGAGIKILGDGELKKKLQVHAHAFSAWCRPQAGCALRPAPGSPTESRAAPDLRRWGVCRKTRALIRAGDRTSNNTPDSAGGQAFAPLGRGDARDGRQAQAPRAARPGQRGA